MPSQRVAVGVGKFENRVSSFLYYFLFAVNRALLGLVFSVGLLHGGTSRQR